jgi:hypothetical protein
MNVKLNDNDFRNIYNNYNYLWNYLISPEGYMVYTVFLKLLKGEISHNSDITVTDIRVYSGGLPLNKTYDALGKLEKYGFIKRKKRRGRSNEYLIYSIPELTSELIDKAHDIALEIKTDIKVVKKSDHIDEDGFISKSKKEKNEKEYKNNKKEYKQKKTNSFAQKGKVTKQKDKEKANKKRKITKYIKKWFNAGYNKWYNVDYDPKDNKNYSKRCQELFHKFRKQFPDDDLKVLMNERIKRYIIWAFRNYEEYIPYVTNLYPGNLTDVGLMTGWFKSLGKEEVKALKTNKKPKNKKKTKKKKGMSYKDKTTHHVYIRGTDLGIIDDVRGHNKIYGTNHDKIRHNTLSSLLKDNIVDYEFDDKVKDILWWSELPKDLLDEIHDLLGYGAIDKELPDIGINALGSVKTREWKEE